MLPSASFRRSPNLFSRRSYLFSTSTSGCSMLVSRTLLPMTSADHTHTTRSAPDTCCRDLRTPSSSTASATLLRNPAVSVTITGIPSSSSVTSMASRVVPGRSDTMAASRPARTLSRLDLPVLGHPARTTRNPSRSSSEPAERQSSALIWLCNAWMFISMAGAAASATPGSSAKSTPASIWARICINCSRQDSNLELA